MPPTFTRWLSAPVRRTARPGWRPQVTELEDRSTPATFSGNTITLDVPNEFLTLSALGTPGSYQLNSTGGVNGTSGPVTYTPAAGTVNVVDSATGTRLGFTSGTYANPFTVTLDDAPGQRSVMFSNTINFGANDLSVTTTRDISVGTTTGIGVTNVNTTSGNITFSANQQATPSSGKFVGVFARGSVLSGTGNVSVSGRGGDDAGGAQIGVVVADGARLGTIGSGSVNVVGTGGLGAGGYNFGVQVSIRGAIVSGGGSVSVTGNGANVGDYNYGVLVNNIGAITAGGGGAVSVTGTGGVGGTAGNTGVSVDGDQAVISSGGGNVTVNGTGGGAGLTTDVNNHGVFVSAGGKISAGGTGAITITGRGDTAGTAAPINGNVGVIVAGTSTVTTSGGPISFVGTAGTYRAIVVQDETVITTTTNSSITFTADTMELNGGQARTGGTGANRISAEYGTVTLQPLTPGTVVALGGIDDARRTPATLGLADFELDAISPRGTLVIGGTTAGRIDVLATIERPGITFGDPRPVLRLVTTGDLTASPDGFIFIGGEVVLSVGGTYFPYPSAGYDFSVATTVSATAGTTLGLPINDPLTYTLLTVRGAIDLTGMKLALSGSYVPPVGASLTLVASTGPLTGTFVGLPNGAIISFNGVDLTITYLSNAVIVTAVTGPPPPAPRVVTAVGDTATVPNPSGSGTRTFVPFPGFTVSVASADLTGDRVPDVVFGAGPGGGPHVRVFDGATGGELASFFAFPVGFTGGVTVAATAGRVVVGAGPGGGPQVKVIDAARLRETRANGELADSALLATFYVYELAFTGGVNVAVADVTGDRVPDVVVGARAGGGPHVKGIDGTRLGQVRPDGVIAESALFANFFAYDVSLPGGVFVAATAGQFAVGAGAGIDPQVKLFDGRGVRQFDFLAFDLGFRGGVRVGFGDAEGDGDVDLLTGAGPGGGPHLKAFNLAPFVEVRSVFVGDTSDTRGVVV